VGIAVVGEAMIRYRIPRVPEMLILLYADEHSRRIVFEMPGLEEKKYGISFPIEIGGKLRESKPDVPGESLMLL
jgi:hypothetical protein